MYINPISNYPPPKQLSFNSNRRSIYDTQGRLLYKTTTCFFREDLNWDSFVRLLQQKYQNIPKINIINHACSNGAEPFSLIIKLIQKLSKEAAKFFPILAKDLDFDNIENAKNGRIGINFNDIYQINSHTKNKITEFFQYGKSNNPVHDISLIPNDNIRDKVIFSQANILKDLSEKQANNTVLLCRNFWPYLNLETRKLLASLLSQNIGENSLLVIGSFDRERSTLQLLEKNGFKETFIENVFTKP